jgi:transaldolase
MKQLKIFLDGADKSSMVEMAKNPLVKGFTTNPSLMKKAGVTSYPSFCKEIAALLEGKPVSFEVFADDLTEMERQALEIASWEKPHSQIYVKIPVMNTRGQSTASLIKNLSHNKVKLNVTAIYTTEQVQEICVALKGGAPSIVSVFAGRIADAGHDPVPIMSHSLRICESSDPSIELLWASTREAYNIMQAEQIGCHIITAPIDVLKKVSNFGKSLMDLSLETIKTFKADSDAAGFSL